MTLDLEWLTENHIMLAKFTGTVSIEDIKKGIKFVDDFALQQPGKKLYLIMDNSQVLEHGFKMFDMAQLFSKTKFQKHPLAYVVIINGVTSPIIRVIRMMDLFIGQITGIHFCVVHDLPAALTFLEGIGITRENPQTA